MRWLLQVRSELRKLTTTKMPLGFLLGLIALSATTVTAVLIGTDADGSKGFISTAADQQSLTAFAANAMMIAALFGAIAVAREYGHGTVVPTYLASPRRHRAVLAQLVAVAIAGGLLGLVGNALTLGGVALALPAVEYEFMLDTGTVARLLSASAFTGALGALLGAGVGSVVRNVGGSVTATVFLLFILPPLAVQMASGAIDWVPNALALVVSGVTEQPSVGAALAVLGAYGLVPAAVGIAAVLRRDVV